MALDFFPHLNLGDELHEKVNMIFMDAKNYVHLTDEKYDLIINDSIHPRAFADNSSLYSREYFQDVKDKLREGGLMTTWVPLYSMTDEVFRSIAGTMTEVFEHVTLWFPGTQVAPLVFLVGSREPQRFSLLEMEKRLRDEAVRRSLAGVGVRDSVDLMSCYICDEKTLKDHLEPFSINSDYSPFVEFSTGLFQPLWDLIKWYVLGAKSGNVAEHLDWGGFSPQGKENWMRSYEKTSEAAGFLLLAESSDDHLERLWYYLRGLTARPAHAALLKGLRNSEGSLFTTALDLIRGGRSREAMQFSGEMLTLSQNLESAWRIRSRAALQEGDADGALEFSNRAVKLAPEEPRTHSNLGFVLFRSGRYTEAVEAYRRALAAGEESGRLSGTNRIRLLTALMRAYSAAGKPGEAKAAAQEGLQLAITGELKDEADVFRRALMRLEGIPAP
jgi:Flp pilus assembly protein TadD